MILHQHVTHIPTEETLYVYYLPYSTPYTLNTVGLHIYPR